MVVKRIEFKNYTLSIGTNYSSAKSFARKEFIEHPMLNVYHPLKGNPIVEDLMDKVVLNRSIPLDDGIETILAIKDKCPYMEKYLEGCLQALRNYKKMV